MGFNFFLGNLALPRWKYLFLKLEVLYDDFLINCGEAVTTKLKYVKWLEESFSFFFFFFKENLAFVSLFSDKSTYVL